MGEKKNPSTTTDKSKHLSIAHNIFLTKEQRYLLQNPGTEVKVLGVSIPYFNPRKKVSEPAEEVFVEYLIKCLEGADARFIFHHNYYELQLLPSMTKNLLDIKDDGIGCLIFANHSGFKQDKEVIHCIHYVSIQDEEILKESLESNVLEGQTNPQSDGVSAINGK